MRSSDLTHWGRDKWPPFSRRHFQSIFLNENVWISLKISLKFVPKVPINNIPALVLIMACRRPGDKPLSEPMMVCLLTHKYVTRPQSVNSLWLNSLFPPGRCDSDLKNVISEHMLQISFWITSNEAALRWIPQNTFGGKLTLVQWMAWCHQATSHSLNQCWPRSIWRHQATVS